MNKTCKKCHHGKTLESFRSLRDRYNVVHDEWKSNICLECENAKKRTHYKKHAKVYIQRTLDWRKKHPNTRRKHWLKEKFKMTLEDYDLLFKQQNECCAICYQPKNGKHFAVDHNHQTGKVRGLLCSNCNTALGLFKDDVTRLQTAIHYLTRMPANL